MGENALGICVAFTAENFVAADGEPIEKILLLGRGFLDEGRERGFESLYFSWMNIKVRVKANEVRQRIHLRNVHLACKGVEQPVSPMKQCQSARAIHAVARGRRSG